MRVFIYGAGRVGRSIGRALIARPDSGLEVIGAWNRTFAAALASSLVLDTPVSSGDLLPEDFPRADVVLLTVVDDAVVETARRLAPHLSRKQILLHTSGSLPSTVMAVDGMPASLGGCHPLQSLAARDGNPDLLHGATFAIEGDARGLEAARALAAAVGGEAIALSDPASKVYYHAAAVVAANYLTVLVDAAATLHAAAGIDARTSVRILAPLLRGTLDNLLAHAAEDSNLDGRAALASSLTGPVARGDAGTVVAHLNAITRLAKKEPDAADLPDLYRALLRRAIQMAERVHVDPEALAHLRKLGA